LFYYLELFKQVYFRLIDETAKKLKSRTRYRPDSDVGRHWRGDLWDPLEALLLPYKYLIIMYITSDLLLRQERPPDKDTLYNKFAVAYDSLREIHTKLHESITPLITSQFYSDLPEPLNIQSGLSPEEIKTFIRIFKKLELDAFVEPVLAVLWKIVYPTLSHPLYTSEEKRRKGALKDWRNFISV
jgi:hypothetical protein